MADALMTVVALANSARVPLGRLADALDEAAIQTEQVAMHVGELPRKDNWEAIVVLGGHMGAYEAETHPWLGPEMDFIRWGLAESIPILGICLGSQLIAHASGGRAYLGDVPETGYFELAKTAAGAADPVVSVLMEPVLAVHRDTFDVPADSQPLASTDLYTQAYRHGSALGVQFHPETDVTILTRWIAEGGLDDMVALTGATTADLLAEAVLRDESTAADSQRLFEAWIENDVY